MPMTTPPSAGMSTTSSSIGSPEASSVGCQEMVTLPAPGTLKLVALYWSPWAWRPMMIGLVQPGTRRGMLLMMIGSRKTTPPRMLRIVPFGETHIFFRSNSSTRASSGVIVALDADAVLLDGVRRVDRDLVVGLVALLDRQVVVLEVD